MSNAVLHHAESGRSPLMIAALAASICFCVFAISLDAPWWFYPPVIFATCGSAYTVLFNPKSGMSIDPAQLRVFSANWSRSVDLADIASISIIDWSDGPATTTANLKDGSSFAIPSVCLPKKQALIDAARQYGIPLL